jgi:hypothetical protein
MFSTLYLAWLKNQDRESLRNGIIEVVRYFVCNTSNRSSILGLIVHRLSCVVALTVSDMNIPSHGMQNILS